MITRVVFRDPPELPLSLRQPQPMLRGWHWMSIGAVLGLSLGVVLGMMSAPRLSPEAERYQRLVNEAHLRRLRGEYYGVRDGTDREGRSDTGQAGSL